MKVWRTIRTPLTLLVLLGILGFGAWWGYQNVIAPPPPPPVVPCVPQDVEDDLQADQITVRVFNGGAARGTAGEVGQALEAAGFTVSSVGNTEEEVGVTTVVGIDEEDPAVRLTLAQFEGAEVRPDNRPDGTVDVLVGSDYEGMVSDAPDSIEIEGDSVCLPPSPTPGAES